MKRSAAPTQNLIQNDPSARRKFKPVIPTPQEYPPSSFYSQSTQDTSAIVAYIDKQKPLRRFSVVYAKASSRKHKRWENDGILIAQHNTLLLESMDDGQKRVAASYKNNKVEVEELGAGLSLLIGGFEVQIQNEIFEQTFVEHAVFCEPSALQEQLFLKFQDVVTLNDDELADYSKRLACHPAILYQRLHQLYKLNEKSEEIPYILDAFPSIYSSENCYLNESGKLVALLKMVTTFNDQNERAVVVASSTNALDFIEAMFKFIFFNVFRLDRRTASVREVQIRTFNTVDLDGIQPNRVLLMHADTQTSGMDITGTKRLILFDVGCWSSDLCIKEKVWRKSQNNDECCIYRLVTSNTFEEEAFRNGDASNSQNAAPTTVIEVKEFSPKKETNSNDETLPA